MRNNRGEVPLSSHLSETLFLGNRVQEVIKKKKKEEVKFFFIGKHFSSSFRTGLLRTGLLMKKDWKQQIRLVGLREILATRLTANRQRSDS